MKIISGGQTGADQAGLFAGKDSGFNTGGTAPRGFRTLGGPAPELADFGLTEHKERGYQHRTADNVINSDATIRLAFNFKSTGEKCTLSAIKKYNKPYIDIQLDNQTDPFIVAEWLHKLEVKVLNVAGNGDGEINGKVFDTTYEYLMKVFSQYRKYFGS